jgi:hypothetical protein
VPRTFGRKIKNKINEKHGTTHIWGTAYLDVAYMKSVVVHDH